MNKTMTGESQDKAAVLFGGGGGGDGYVVAVPYPARGHINPMICFCSVLASKGISVIIVLTEEWLELIGGSPPIGCRVVTIPNVIPSEKDRTKDMTGFFKAVATDMKSALNSLLDGLDVTVSSIVADVSVIYMMGLADDKRNDTSPPIVSLWISAASMFFAYYHFDLIMAAYSDGEKNDTEVRIDNIPFEFPVKSVEISFANHKSNLVNKGIQSIVQTSTTTNALLISSYEELEPEIINALRASLQIPLYAIGPCIPYLSLKPEPEPSYVSWLDSCPKDSVLYISLGSFEKLPDEELEEISKGLKASKVRYIWSVRGDYISNLKEDCGEMGIIVPWCDQLKVLCHPSVGGFLTHCGWNSVMDAIFAGVPMITFPLVLDQVHICSLILNQWGIGLKLKDKNGDDQNIIRREEVTSSVAKLMDLNENGNGDHELRKRLKEYQEICRKAIQSGGSTDLNVTSFIRDILLKESS